MKLKLLNLIIPVQLFIASARGRQVWLRRNLFLIPGTLTVRWACFIFIIILITQSANAQVVIKERVEINVDKSHTLKFLKSTGEQTPFYGDVTIGFNCTAGGASTKVTLRVGDASKRIYPGWEPDCRPGYPWFCNGWMYDAIENQPAFSPVSIEMEACKTITGNPNDTQWHMVPVSIGDIVNNSAPVYAYINSPDTPAVWPHIANLGFIQKIPPDCNSQFDCTTNFHLPEIKVNLVQNGYNNYDVCVKNEGYAGSKPIFNDFEYFPSISACFNRDLQSWWFNINNNNSILFNFIIAMCTEKITIDQKELISDWSGFPPNYECDKIINDLMAHFAYGALGAHYLLENVLFAHEDQHKKDFEYLIQMNEEVFYDSLLTDLKPCEAFITLQEAQNYWENKFEIIFSSFRSKIKRSWNEKTGIDENLRYAYETNVQNSFAVKSQIWNQINLVMIFYGCKI